MTMDADAWKREAMTHKDRREVKIYEVGQDMVADVQERFKKKIYDIVIDVGPGIRPQSFIQSKTHILIDPYRDYLDHIRMNIGFCPNIVYLHGDALSVLPALLDKSAQVIIAGDVIEHMTKEDGILFINQAKRVARENIVIFTPLGYQAQHYHEGMKDRWGMNGAMWQEHKSGWIPHDFGPEWEILMCEHYHFEDEHGKNLEVGFGAFFAILSQEKPSIPGVRILNPR